MTRGEWGWTTCIIDPVKCIDLGKERKGMEGMRDSGKMQQ